MEAARRKARAVWRGESGPSSEGRVPGLTLQTRRLYNILHLYSYTHIYSVRIRASCACRHNITSIQVYRLNFKVKPYSGSRVQSITKIFTIPKTHAHTQNPT